MPNPYQAGAGAGGAGDMPAAVLTPGDLYVTADDQLRITAFNALTGVVLTIRGRLRGCDGVTRPFSETLTPTSDRVATNKIVRLSEGWLSNVLVVASSAAPLTGQTFVRIALVHGEGTPAIEVAALAAGYVTAQQPIAWPGSPILNSLDGCGALRSIAGATPAAGAEISETVPTGARWELIALKANLSTSAAVASRNVVLQFTDGALLFAAMAYAINELASNNFVYSWTQGGQVVQSSTTGFNSNVLPGNNRLSAGFKIATNILNGQVGDQWSLVQYLVREWIEGA